MDYLRNLLQIMELLSPTSEQMIECISSYPVEVIQVSVDLLVNPSHKTGVGAASLRPHSLVDNLLPDISQKVENRQAKQKLSHDMSKTV